jgi:hypothetical protein
MRGRSLLEIPDEVLHALGKSKRATVVITINGHTWKSRVAIMRGRSLLGLLGIPTATAVLHFRHPITTKMTSLTDLDASAVRPAARAFAELLNA